MQERKPVFLGQHEVEDDDIVIGGLGLVAPLFAVVGDVDGKPLFLKSLSQGTHKRFVIFNQEYAHGPLHLEHAVRFLVTAGWVRHVWLREGRFERTSAPSACVPAPGSAWLP